uniref:Secreted protein n=1 Tax=Anguilla anguilla TaxID=7936 RepID=A0A0E9WU97_ANGAN
MCYIHRFRTLHLLLHLWVPRCSHTDQLTLFQGDSWLRNKDLSLQSSDSPLCLAVYTHSLQYPTLTSHKVHPSPNKVRQTLRLSLKLADQPRKTAMWNATRFLDKIIC